MDLQLTNGELRDAGVRTHVTPGGSYAAYVALRPEAVVFLRKVADAVEAILNTEASIPLTEQDAEGGQG